MKKFHFGIFLSLFFASAILFNQVKATTSNQNIDTTKTLNSSQTQLGTSLIDNDYTESELQTIHEMANKENEILLLKKDQQIHHIELAKLRQQRTLSFFIFFFVLVFIIFIFNRLNFRKKTIKLLEEKSLLIKKQKEELKAISTSKDKMFSIIAHDLKSPFNSILGFMNELKTNYDEYSDEERRNMIHILSDSCNNAYSLLENLLTWSISQRGHIKIIKELLNLNELTDEASAPYLDAASLKNINIKNEVPKSMKIYADKNTLRTVIGNLCNNGIKFTHKGGQVIVTAINTEAKTHISIIDNGIGMNQKTIDSLFQINKTSSMMGTNNEKGTGLGLIICKEFVEKNKGKILVESTEGKGSTFRIQLPIDNGK